MPSTGHLKEPQGGRKTQIREGRRETEGEGERKRRRRRRGMKGEGEVRRGRKERVCREGMVELGGYLGRWKSRRGEEVGGRRRVEGGRGGGKRLGQTPTQWEHRW